MDDFLNDNTERDDGIQEKKKIVIKHRRIKRATRTYLYNIDHWMEKDDITALKKQVQKKLATSSQVVTDDEGCALTFNGDHTSVIKDMVISNSSGKLTKAMFE